MMALIIAAVATFGMTGMIVVYARFRPIGTPHSWGEAMLGATFVFFLLFVAYGILPHQWLTFADKDLLWRSDKFFEPWLSSLVLAVSFLSRDLVKCCCPKQPSKTSLPLPFMWWAG